MSQETPNNGWRQVTCCQTIHAHRKGWLGAWDALIAAITRRPRLQVPRNVMFSVWVKGGPVQLQITQPGAEVKP